MTNKMYFIEVYGNEFGNGENEAEFIGQEEYPSLLAAYDAAKDIPAMYSGLNFERLEIVDSEDLNRVYYKMTTLISGILEPELQKLIDERNNAVEENAVEVGDDDKAIEIQQINAYIRSERNQIENCNIAIDSFKNELEYLEKSFNKYLEKNDAAGMVDAAETIKSKLQHIAKVEGKIANCEKRIETLKAELAQHTEKTAVEENAVEEKIENAQVENKEVSEMKSFRIYLKTWNHILANIVTAQVVNAINKEINPADWQESEKVLIYKNCNLSDKEIAKIRDAVTKINCRFVLEEVEMENAAISENVESENMTADVGEEFNNITEEIMPSIDDELFAQAGFINKGAEYLVSGAAACKYGDLTIEGKLVTLPDKKGRPRYYAYNWDNIRDYACGTSLTPISEEEARKIAAKWHLAFSPMTFEEYMTASNAEYKKIRTIYLKEGGAIVRQYDKDLADEIENSEKFNAKIISCLDLYFVNSDDAAAVEESNVISAYWDAADKWSKESDEILEKTVYAALQNGNSIKLFKQGCTNLEECIELIDCYTLTKKDAEEKTFCSDMYEEGGEVTFTPVSPKGVSYSLADYKTKEQFQAVAIKLAESIQRGDKQFIFPTIEELNAPAAVNFEPKKFEIGYTYAESNSDGTKIENPYIYKVIDRTATNVTFEQMNGYGIYNHHRRRIEFDDNGNEYISKKFKMGYVHSSNCISNPLKDKIARLKDRLYFLDVDYLRICRDAYVKMDGEYYTADKFDDYATNYADTFYYKDGDKYIEDAEIYHELKRFERELNANYSELERLENIAEKAEILKAKIAEQKSRRNKSVIDWSATLAEMKFEEIKTLQSKVKNFLKLGEIELAESLFNQIKILCRNYREQFAA